MLQAFIWLVKMSAIPPDFLKLAAQGRECFVSKMKTPEGEQQISDAIWAWVNRGDAHKGSRNLFYNLQTHTLAENRIQGVTVDRSSEQAKLDYDFHKLIEIFKSIFPNQQSEIVAFINHKFLHDQNLENFVKQATTDDLKSTSKHREKWFEKLYHKRIMRPLDEKEFLKTKPRIKEQIKAIENQLKKPREEIDRLNASLLKYRQFFNLTRHEFLKKMEKGFKEEFSDFYQIQARLPEAITKAHANDDTALFALAEQYAHFAGKGPFGRLLEYVIALHRLPGLLKPHEEKIKTLLAAKQQIIDAVKSSPEKTLEEEKFGLFATNIHANDAELATFYKQKTIPQLQNEIQQLYQERYNILCESGINTIYAVVPPREVSQAMNAMKQACQDFRTSCDLDPFLKRLQVHQVIEIRGFSANVTKKNLIDKIGSVDITYINHLIDLRRQAITALEAPSKPAALIAYHQKALQAKVVVPTPQTPIQTQTPTEATVDPTPVPQPTPIVKEETPSQAAPKPVVDEPAPTPIPQPPPAPVETKPVNQVLPSKPLVIQPSKRVKPPTYKRMWNSIVNGFKSFGKAIRNFFKRLFG